MAENSRQGIVFLVYDTSITSTWHVLETSVITFQCNHTYIDSIQLYDAGGVTLKLYSGSTDGTLLQPLMILPRAMMAGLRCASAGRWMRLCWWQSLLAAMLILPTLSYGEGQIALRGYCCTIAMYRRWTKPVLMKGCRYLPGTAESW